MNIDDVNEPQSGTGWSAYQPIDGNTVEDDGVIENKKGLKGYVDAHSWNQKSQKYDREYASLINASEDGAFLDFFTKGEGFHWHSQNDLLYEARANYLWNHKWMSIRFGYFTVEYSLFENTAYSYTSDSRGISFQLHYELILGDESEADRKEGLAHVFRETETHLYNLIKTRKPGFHPF